MFQPTSTLKHDSGIYRYVSAAKKPLKSRNRPGDLNPGLHQSQVQPFIYLNLSCVLLQHFNNVNLLPVLELNVPVNVLYIIRETRRNWFYKRKKKTNETNLLNGHSLHFAPCK